MVVVVVLVMVMVMVMVIVMEMVMVMIIVMVMGIRDQTSHRCGKRLLILLCDYRSCSMHT